MLQAAIESCEARVWGNCYKLIRLLKENLGKKLYMMLVGAAKRHIGESATSCHLELLKKSLGEIATSCQLELLKESLGKLLQANKAAERELGETATSGNWSG